MEEPVGSGSEAQKVETARWLSAARWLTSVPIVAGRSLVGRVALFFAGAYLFLWVPDIDLVLIGLLHHRSIITHSILPGLLLLFFGRKLGAAPVSGALIGTSVHLSADLLSPMVGYAQIWLPAPYNSALGDLSYLWLAGNAVIGFGLASLITRSAFGHKISLPLILVVSASTGLVYGVVNEEAVSAVLITWLILLMSLFPEANLRGRLSRAVSSPATHASSRDATVDKSTEAD